MINSKFRCICILVVVLALFGCGGSGSSSSSGDPLSVSPLSEEGHTLTASTIGSFSEYSSETLSLLDTSRYRLQASSKTECPTSDSWYQLSYIGEGVAPITPDCIRVIKDDNTVTDPSTLATLDGTTIETRYNDRAVAYSYKTQTEVTVLDDFLYTEETSIKDKEEFRLDIKTKGITLTCINESKKHQCSEKSGKDIAYNAQLGAEQGSGKVNYQRKKYTPSNGKDVDIQLTKKEEDTRNRAAEKKVAEEKAAAEKKAAEEKIAAEKKVAAEKKAAEEKIAAEKKASEEKVAVDKESAEKKEAADLQTTINNIDNIDLYTDIDGVRKALYNSVSELIADYKKIDGLKDVTNQDSLISTLKAEVEKKAIEEKAAKLVKDETLYVVNDNLSFYTGADDFLPETFSSWEGLVSQMTGGNITLVEEGSSFDEDNVCHFLSEDTLTLTDQEMELTSQLTDSQLGCVYFKENGVKLSKSALDSKTGVVRDLTMVYVFWNFEELRDDNDEPLVDESGADIKYLKKTKMEVSLTGGVSSIKVSSMFRKETEAYQSVPGQDPHQYRLLYLNSGYTLNHTCEYGDSVTCTRTSNPNIEWVSNFSVRNDGVWATDLILNGTLIFVSKGESEVDTFTDEGGSSRAFTKTPFSFNFKSSFSEEFGVPRVLTDTSLTHTAVHIKN